LNSLNPVKSFGSDGKQDGVKSADPLIKHYFNSGTQVVSNVITAYDESLEAEKSNFSYNAYFAFSGILSNKS